MITGARAADRMCSLLTSCRPEAEGDLLARFVSARDHGAFAELLARHGPMVLGLCRRVLGDAHDAEDAFQATFLVLARKAGSIRRPESLASWLHGTAFRLALRLRRRNCSREQREGRTPARSTPSPLDELSARELLTTVDEELRKLPETYRLPIVLCCLEGLSQEEAAHRLGCSASSIKGRLERGRVLLRERLAGRGLALPTTLTGLLLAGAGPASVPPALTGSTLAAAVTGTGASAAATALADGLGMADLFARLRAACAGLLLVGVLAAGAGLAAPAPSEPAPAAAAADGWAGASAEELFRRFEKQAQQSKSLFVAYTGERITREGPQTTRSYYGGTYHSRPDERVMHSFDHDHPKVGSHATGQSPKDPVFGQLTRSGCLLGDPFRNVLIPVRDLKFVEPKAGIDPPGCKVITYTLHLHRGGKTPPYAVTLWLDEKSLAPLKRTLHGADGREFEITERYYGFSTRGIPALFRAKPVPAVVVSGRVAARVGTSWVPTEFLLEGVTYRAEEATRLFVAGGAKVTLAPASEFTVGEGRPAYDLRLSRGRLSAELPGRDPLQVVLGPVRLACAWHVGGRALVTATPDRVVVEQGGVEYAGVSAEPSSRIGSYVLSGHLLHEGVEYRLASGQLRGQPERTLPAGARPRERVLFRLDLDDPKATRGRLAAGERVRRDGRAVLAAVPAPGGAARSLAFDLGREDLLVARPTTVLRFRCFRDQEGTMRLTLRNRAPGAKDPVRLITPCPGRWTTVTLPFKTLFQSEDVEYRLADRGVEKIRLPAPRAGDRYGRVEWTAQGAEPVFFIDQLEVVETEP